MWCKLEPLQDFKCLHFSLQLSLNSILSHWNIDMGGLTFKTSCIKVKTRNHRLVAFIIMLEIVFETMTKILLSIKSLITDSKLVCAQFTHRI